MATEHPLGRHAGYTKAVFQKAQIKRIREKMTSLPGRSRMAQAHRMFQHGYDTLEIANLMFITEPEAVKLLDKARERLIELRRAA